MVTDYTKQEELINIVKFNTENNNQRINVIGCGALGSWIVLFLLKMGFKNIHVYDFDVVEEHNLPNQMFNESDIGVPKVEAIQKMYENMFNDATPRLFIHNYKITQQNMLELNNGFTMCCVDSMEVRKEIFTHSFKFGLSNLFIEGRLSIYGAYIYTLNEKNTTVFSMYEKTLYADEEAEVSACGVSQTALPAAVNCASIMIMQLIEHINNKKINNEIQYSIPWLTNIVNSFV